MNATEKPLRARAKVGVASKQAHAAVAFDYRSGHEGVLDQELHGVRDILSMSNTSRG